MKQARNDDPSTQVRDRKDGLLDGSQVLYVTYFLNVFFVGLMVFYLVAPKRRILQPSRGEMCNSFHAHPRVDMCSL